MRIFFKELNNISRFVAVQFDDTQTKDDCNLRNKSGNMLISNQAKRKIKSYANCMFTFHVFEDCVSIHSTWNTHTPSHSKFDVSIRDIPIDFTCTNYSILRWLKYQVISRLGNFVNDISVTQVLG